MQVSLLNIVVELKKCCNHPFLFESADHGYGGDTNFLGSTKLERIILSSGKLVILDKLMDRLHQSNHRVLIFSQVGYIFIIQPVCDEYHAQPLLFCINCYGLIVRRKLEHLIQHCCLPYLSCITFKQVRNFENEQQVCLCKHLCSNCVKQALFAFFMYLFLAVLRA